MPMTPGPLNGLSAARLELYLQMKSSPMVGEGAGAVEVGVQFGLDPRVLIAVAGAESGFGKNVTSGKNNAWNWLYNGRNSPFDSWRSGMVSVAKGLTKPTSTYDMSSTRSFYLNKYCHGVRCSEGLRDVDQFMRELDGQINALGCPVGLTS